MKASVFMVNIVVALRFNPILLKQTSFPRNNAPMLVPFPVKKASLPWMRGDAVVTAKETCLDSYKASAKIMASAIARIDLRELMLVLRRRW